MTMTDDVLLDRLRGHLVVTARRSAPVGLEDRVIGAALRSRRIHLAWRSELVLGSAVAVAASVVLALGAHERPSQPHAPTAIAPRSSGHQGLGAGGDNHNPKPPPVTYPAPPAAAVTEGIPAPDGRPTTTFVILVTTARPGTRLLFGGPAFLSMPGFDPYLGGIPLCGGDRPPCVSGHRYERTFVGLQPGAGSPGVVGYKFEAFPDGRVFAAGTVNVAKSLIYTATYAPLP